MLTTGEHVDPGPASEKVRQPEQAREDRVESVRRQQMRHLRQIENHESVPGRGAEVGQEGCEELRINTPGTYWTVSH